MNMFTLLKEGIAGGVGKLYGQISFTRKVYWNDNVQNGEPDFNSKHGNSDKSRYLKFILLFGVIFTVLQISDLIITHYVLKKPEITELNPFYGQDWFVPFKLTMVLLVMATMYQFPAHSHGLAKKAMVGMIYIYVFINLNNLYFMLR